LDNHHSQPILYKYHKHLEGVLITPLGM
jgi:hypothetical protein